MTNKEKEDLKELKRYQNWFKRQISSKDWDSISDRISDLHIDIIGRVMRAESPNEINYIIWKQLDYIKDVIRRKKKALQ